MTPHRMKVERKREKARHKKKKLAERDGLVCCWCKKELPLNKLTVEHITRLADGGTNAMTNLALACYKCNIKRDRVNNKPKRKLSTGWDECPKCGTPKDSTAKRCSACRIGNQNPKVLRGEIDLEALREKIRARVPLKYQ